MKDETKLYDLFILGKKHGEKKANDFHFGFVERKVSRVKGGIESGKIM